MAAAKATKTVAQAESAFEPVERGLWTRDSRFGQRASRLAAAGRRREPRMLQGLLFVDGRLDDSWAVHAGAWLGFGIGGDLAADLLRWNEAVAVSRLVDGSRAGPGRRRRVEKCASGIGLPGCLEPLGRLQGEIPLYY